IEADDQAIQTILLGLPEDIYAAADSYETAQEIWLRVQQMMKVLHQDQPLPSTYMQQLLLNNNIISQPLFNQNYMQQPMPNPEDITDPTTAMNMALTLMAKAFKLNYSTPNNNKQRISSNPRNTQIAQPVQNVGNQVVQNAVQNLRVQNVGNQNGLIVVSRIANQNPNGNGNVVAARAKGNATRNNAEVHNYDNCYDNEIFNMFTQEEQYTELLEPIPEPHQVPQNDNYVISEVSSVEQSGGTVEQHPANVEETPDESLAKHKALELEIQRLLRAMVGETHALSKPVTSNSIPTPQESKVVKNNKVIAPGMFRINSFKPFREEKYVPNKVRASVRTNPITVSQPPVITKKVVNSDSNGLSSTGVDNTVKTRKLQLIQRMIGSLLRLRVVAARIKKLK
nr:hypothetical protein [Tanacetum cinerariifolium]